jgi:hypothetical protein
MNNMAVQLTRAARHGLSNATLMVQQATVDAAAQAMAETEREAARWAAGDGGCRWPGCEQPPAWTESHHNEN